MIKTSYLEVYIDEIIPWLQAIDLQLKSGDEIEMVTAADLLKISEDEMMFLRGGTSRNVTSNEFLELMRRGSSDVCGMYRRELERSSPVIYTADDIAYIYGIEHELVQTAFDKLNANAVTEYLLPEVFAEIWV